jgi:Tol biopolymer transport system component
MFATLIGTGRPLGLLLLVLFLAGGCGEGKKEEESARGGAEPPPADSLWMVGEVHLRNVRQLTFGGENAEAYFSPDGRQLVLQSTHGDDECDQIYRMPVEGGDLVRVNDGRGRSTCAYFLPDGESILYATTGLTDPDCPPPPDFSQGYVWALYPGYDIVVKSDGGEVTPLTETPGYDAEATVSPRGDRIVFTSVRSGDLELYSMNLDGSGVKRLTHEPGYDGGAFYSPDGSEIVYRAWHPRDSQDLIDYRQLLDRALIRPGVLNLYVMNADGTDRRLVLENGAANFAPYFFPDGERIIFASNLGDPGGRNFDLFMIGKEGTGLERVTTNETFDGFPMFSPDGRYLVFASNRNNQSPHDTNVFIAEWME